MEPVRFFTLSLDLLCVIGFDGCFEWVNPAFGRITGYSSNELVGNHFSVVAHPDDVAQTSAAIERIAAGASIRSFQCRCVCKDGSVRWVLWNANPFMDEGAFYATGRDVTERIAVENDLREAEEERRQILDAIPDMVVCKAPGSRITWANRAFRTYVGMSNEELQLIIDAPFASADEIQRFAKDDAHVFATGEVLEIPEEPITDCQGVTRLFNTVKSPIVDSSGDVVMLVAIARDITARKQAESEMMAAWQVAEEAHAEIESVNENLEAAVQWANALAVSAEVESHAKGVMLSVIPSILIGINEAEHVTEWNPAAQRAFGRTAEEVVGLPFADSGIQWDWRRVLQCLREHRKCAKSRALDEVRYVRLDGVERILGITLTPVLDASGCWRGSLLQAADITEHKMLESQLAHAQKMESIGQLAAGIAHEINTPIQYVGDNTRFLLESFADIERLLDSYASLLTGGRAGRVSLELVAGVETAIENADLGYLMAEIPCAIQQSLGGIGHVARIVQAMKEFSHPGLADKTPIDINRALDSTITVTRNVWKYVADMETDFAADLPMVPCLPGDFNQVILNVIVNAAHAIEAVIGKQAATKGKIAVSTRREEEWAEIRIRDTGTGIPEAIRNKVFDPFFTTKEVGRGTGQGLAIAHSIVVEKHQGAIYLESEVGVGTTFIIRLPLSLPVESAKAA